jgi:hypothetical protein
MAGLFEGFEDAKMVVIETIVDELRPFPKDRSLSDILTLAADLCFLA